jgi:hypothetical protein
MLRRLNLGQRIVLVVALGAVLRTVGSYTVNRRAANGDWFSYMPLTEAPYVPALDPGWHPIPAALLWIALILVWALASVWLLGRSRRSSE